jgi:hypothetical protein
MKRKIYTNILILLLYSTILPLIAIVLLGGKSIIGFAPFFLSIFAVKEYRYYKKEYTFIKVVFLAVSVAFLIEVFCLWGFVFLPKLVWGSSPLILDGKWMYIYWSSLFCFISMCSVEFSLLDWKGDPKLSRRVGILGIIIGIFILILIIVISGLIRK